jgi:hypothetical protein
LAHFERGGKTRALIEFARSIDDDPAYDACFLQNESESVEPHLGSLQAGRQVVLFVDDADAVLSGSTAARPGSRRAGCG